MDHSVEHQRCYITTRAPQCIGMQPFSNSSELLDIMLLTNRFNDDISNGSRQTNTQTDRHHLKHVTFAAWVVTRKAVSGWRSSWETTLFPQTLSRRPSSWWRKAPAGELHCSHRPSPADPLAGEERLQLGNYTVPADPLTGGEGTCRPANRCRLFSPHHLASVLYYMYNNSNNAPTLIMMLMPRLMNGLLKSMTRSLSAMIVSGAIARSASCHVQ